MRLKRHISRFLAVAALILGAALLVACERTAELIPGSATTSADATATSPAGADPTPIVVNPDPGGGGGATGGRVIPDHQLALSIVQVIAVDSSAGSEQAVRYGSGVVVNREEGLIATAYPVVNPSRPDGSLAYTSIVIATDREPGTPAQREFTATLVGADPALDLALLRVTANREGEPIEPGTFDVPQATLGDASVAGVGFSLRVFGYPGAAVGPVAEDQVVQTATATITGQRGMAGHTGRTWFKIDTRMPFGAAGGPVYDRFGALVGILAQDRYVPGGAVGQARPLELLSRLISDAGGATSYHAPLYRTGTMAGSLQPPPNTGILVSTPAFAENATETPHGTDLFDYETRFPARLGALYYEYGVNGASNGATIEERWYLNDVEQQSLSSSFVWSGGAFGLVSDRITAPSPTGIPEGRWRLDVYVDEVHHATATAIVGVDVGTPEAVFQAAASTATPDGSVQNGAFTGAPQLLMLFDVAGMTGATHIEWHVFHNNERIYTSPPVPWMWGGNGRFWVGYRPPEGTIGAGLWEFELHVNGQIVAVGELSLF